MHRKKNRILKQDDSGTFYRDIAFVPSGTLAMKNAAPATSPNSAEEAVSVREFYKSVLAMPRTLNKRPKQRQGAGIGKTTPQKKASQPSSVKIIVSTTNAPESVTTDSGSTSTASLSAASSTVSGMTQTSISSVSEEIISRNWRGQNQTSSPHQSPGPGSPGTATTRTVAEGYVLCEACQIEVREDDMERHCRGTAHLISQESPIKPLDTLALGR
ncbi:hypothetical protein BGX28_005806, partial [Mortierella sp. GBA30]